MAAGDIKGEDVVILKLLAGAAVAKGEVVQLVLADGDYIPAADTTLGKFAVAIEAAADAAEFRAVVKGPVEVTATAAAIAKGALVAAGDTGKVIQADAAAILGIGEIVGTALEAFASGGVQTVYVGLVA